MTKFTLKVQVEGETRRLRDWPENQAKPTLAALQLAVSGLFDLTPEQTEVMKITYQDEDGDHCTLVEATLPDALSFAAQSGVLRVMATHQRPRTSSQTEFFSMEVGDPNMPAETGDPNMPVFHLVEEASLGEPEEPYSASEAGSEAQLGEADEPCSETEAQLEEEAEEEAKEEAEEEPTEAEAQLEEEAEEEAGAQLEEDVEPCSEAEAQLEEQAEEEATEAETNLEEAQLVEEVEAPAEEAEMPPQVAAVNEASEDGSLQGFAEALHRNATDHLSDAQSVARERFETAQPQLADGVEHFKQQVKADFQNTRKDMQDAFGAPDSNVATVVGTAAGFIVAARLAPIRLTPLAALGVAVAAGRDVPNVPVETDEERHVAVDHGDVSELEHLKHQVKNDFHSIRKDISTAFDCILGQAPNAEVAASNEPAAEQDNERPRQQRPAKTFKTAIPAVASSVVGLSVASCLVPFRIARFAVANLASTRAQSSESSNFQLDEATHGWSRRPTYTAAC